MQNIDNLLDSKEISNLAADLAGSETAAKLTLMVEEAMVKGYSDCLNDIMTVLQATADKIQARNTDTVIDV